MPSNAAKWFDHSKRLSLILLVALFLVIAPVVAVNVLNPGGAKAHISPAPPPDPNTASVAIGLSAYKMPGELIIPPATVTHGDVVKYKVTLSFGAVPPGGVGYDFQSGQVKVTLPNGTVVEVAGFGGATPDVPLITAATPWTVEVPVLYTVNLADMVGGMIIAYAAYGVGVGIHLENGYFHNEEGDPGMEHPRTASATTASMVTPTTGNLIIYKYNDLNGNGSWDGGEPYLPGWYFDVTGPQNFPNQMTDGTGKITLSGIATGDYTITEKTPLPAGWVNTDPPGSPPLTKPATVTDGATTEIKFGNRPLGTLIIFKFNDLNGNGIQDGAEGPLSGWDFTVTGGPSPTPGTYTTNGSGLITITDLLPGDYTVTETLKAGWRNTSPGGVAPYVKVGAVPTGGSVTVTFGNQQLGTLIIFKFNDLNGNGVQDGADGPLSGWDFAVTGGPSPTPGPYSTDVNGLITITGLIPGDYTVTETLKAGWRNTSPGGAPPYSKVGVVPAGGDVTVTFGNQELGTLIIFKFNDVNGNGIQDGAEGPLAGWAFTVTGGPSPTPGPYVTDGSGLITITDLIPGSYTVTETLKAGWRNTSPGGVAPYVKIGVVPAGGSATVTFGNQELGTLIIFKFNDLNGNGVQDGADGPLSGWDFTVTGGPSPTPGPYTTNASGLITITGLIPGDYTVTETLKAGWRNTSPGGAPPYSKVGTVPNGGSVTVTFGNQQLGTLIIFKFNDVNGNGIQDGAEGPLAGWAFAVTGGPSPTPGPYTTNASGLITITNLIPGDYTVTETLQPDWQCTTLNPQLGTVPAGASAQVNFGNRYVKKTLKIYKFNDLNGNGVPDAGEVGLGGWEFTISGIGKRITGSDGWIIINITNPDIYKVTETLKASWLCTTDNPQFADLISNDLVILYFGNVEQVEHPPLVPTIGIWGAALMAAAFAGALIWVVALRRRRQTV